MITKHTSSFSFFRECCKVFVFICSLRSLSKSPLFSLLDVSSCSCNRGQHRFRVDTCSLWVANMGQSLKHALLLPLSYCLQACLNLPQSSNLFHHSWVFHYLWLILINFTLLLAACWWAADTPHCCWTCAAPVPTFPGFWGSCGRAE